MPPKFTHMEYIIVATNYLTKWTRSKATTKNDACTTAKFLYKQMFTWFGLFGLSLEVMFDWVVHSVNEIIDFMMSEFFTSHKNLAFYHPQENEQVESTNRNN